MLELTISWRRVLLYLNTRWSFHILGFEPFELSKQIRNTQNNVTGRKVRVQIKIEPKC